MITKMKKRLFFLTLLLAAVLASCDRSPTLYDVTATADPPGSGTVSPADTTLEEGDNLTLEAMPSEGYRFIGWTGDLDTTRNPLELEIDQNYDLVAEFQLKSYELEVATEGEGSVTQRVVAADSETYDHGTVVELAAVPNEGYHFVEWKGDLQSEEDTARITVDEPKQVTAVFEINRYELIVQAEGGGDVSWSPGQEEYEHGTEVELEASPDEGHRFAEWSGDLQGSDNPATVIMDGHKEITGRFVIRKYDLTVQITGDGTVTRDPDLPRYEHGTEVKLTASADDHFEFAKWEGALETTAASGTLTMDADKTAHATFVRNFVIMPLGNSLTNDPGSREQLWSLLTGDGYRVNFVGNQESSSISIPDPDHEGVPGITIQGISDKIESVLSDHSPRYVNLMVGTNDIVWGYDETAQQIADRWNNLVQQILDHTPSGSYVVAATIPPATSKTVGDASLEVRDRAEQIKRYNEALRSHVQARKNNGDNVILADAYAEMNLEDHVSGDGVHLTEEGYALMGTVYYEALINLLGL